MHWIPLVSASWVFGKSQKPISALNPSLQIMKTLFLVCMPQKEGALRYLAKKRKQYTPLHCNQSNLSGHICLKSAHCHRSQHICLNATYYILLCGSPPQEMLLQYHSSANHKKQMAIIIFVNTRSEEDGEQKMQEANGLKSWRVHPALPHQSDSPQRFGRNFPISITCIHCFTTKSRSHSHDLPG